MEWNWMDETALEIQNEKRSFHLHNVFRSSARRPASIIILYIQLKYFKNSFEL